MGLKPYDRQVKDVFNGIQYDVDFYQREYKWSDKLPYKPVSSLLKDIFYRFDLEKYNPNQKITPESISKYEWYYLNSYMTNIINGKTYIVDGQQRLTTLTLISISLFHLANFFKLEGYLIDTLKNSIRGSNEFGETYWMGFKDRTNALDDIFVNNTEFKKTPANISEQNIYKNYKIIHSTLSENLSTAHKLHTFITYFRTRIYLVEIEVDKNKDVEMVFEVINDRGVALRAYEILKGKLLSQIDITDRDKYVEIWESEISKLEEYDEGEIDEFFSYYFRSKYTQTAKDYRELDKNRYHKMIFLEDFDQYIKLRNNEKNVRQFIEYELPYFIQVYTQMLTYYHTYHDEYKWVYFNQLNSIDGQFLLALSAIELNDNEKDEKIKLVSKLYDKHSVISRLTGSYRSEDFNLNTILINREIRHKGVEEIQECFSEQLVQTIRKSQDREDIQEPFKYEFFKSVGYTHFGKNFLRYYFARIDRYISDSSDLPPFGNYYQLVSQYKGKDTYHIEHILANNDTNVALFENEEDFNEQRNRLGGLLLLKGKYNKSSGDEPFDSKLKTYNVVGTYFARSLLEDMYHKKVEFKQFIKDKQLNFKSYSSFAKREVEERHQLLFDLTKLIWEL